MAFGIKPHYDCILHFENANPMQIILAALEVSIRLNWKVDKLSRTGITFYTGINVWSYGEQITLTLQPEHPKEVTLSSCCTGLQIIDYGRNRKNIQRLHQAIQTFLISTPREEIEKMVKNLEESLQERERKETANISLPEKSIPFFSMFIPHKDFFAIPLLLNINVFIFIAMAISGISLLSPEAVELLQWGGNFGPLTLTGDWWRTLTCNFLHFGIIHIAMNMYALLFIGVYLEPLIGKLRTLAAYLLTGICSSASSLFLHPETISVGASGAIFGFYGIFLAYLFFHCIERAQRYALLYSIGIFLAYNLLKGMGNAAIDNAAHIGGLTSGFLIGSFYVLADKQRDKGLKRPYSFIGEGALFLIFILVMAERIHSTSRYYALHREAWDSGMLQKWMAGKISDEELDASLSVNQNLAEPEIPAFTPISDTDTWILYTDTITGFSCRYPTNWQIVEDQRAFFKLTNGVSWMTIVCQTTTSEEEFKRIRAMTPVIPRNKRGEPSEDYIHEKVIINGLFMDKVSNPQHFMVTGSDGFDTTQTVFYYFDKAKLRYFGVVMIAQDEAAKEELDSIAESIYFE